MLCPPGKYSVHKEQCSHSPNRSLCTIANCISVTLQSLWSLFYANSFKITSIQLLTIFFFKLIFTMYAWIIWKFRLDFIDRLGPLYNHSSSRLFLLSVCVCMFICFYAPDCCIYIVIEVIGACGVVIKRRIINCVPIVRYSSAYYILPTL